MAKPNSSDAAVLTGPCGLCGASAIAVRLGQRRDPAGFAQPAAVRDVQLETLARALSKQVAERGEVRSARSPVAIGVLTAR